MLSGVTGPSVFGQNILAQASASKSCTDGTTKSVPTHLPGVKIVAKASNIVNISTPSTAIAGETNKSQRPALSKNKQYRIDPEDTKYKDYVIHWVQLLASQHNVNLIL